MKPPTVKQITKLESIKKSLFNATNCGIKARATAAQMPKPMTEAPTKMKVARLLNPNVEGLTLTKPTKPIIVATIIIKKDVCNKPNPVATPKTADTTINTASNVTQ